MRSVYGAEEKLFISFPAKLSICSPSGLDPTDTHFDKTSDGCQAHEELIPKKVLTKKNLVGRSFGKKKGSMSPSSESDLCHASGVALLLEAFMSCGLSM
jgi:hypothetical protein